MNFKQYPSYKDSGVEWLGEVPEHWSVKKFGYIFRENKIKNSGLIETNVLSLSYGRIKEKNIEDNKGLLPESFETYQIIQPNDIIFRFTDLQNDKRSLRSAISKFHGIITSAYIGVRTTANAEFYNYLFRAYDQQKVFYSMGDGMRQSLKIDELNRMPIVFPSDVEQQQIVSFLDSETSRIDNLIAKQEKLIEKLEEHRKSIISHAVTKGLDPDVPMKDSGIEWLGEVPEHWKLLQTRHIFNFGKGLTITKEDLSDEGIPCINYGEIHSKYGFEFNPLDNPLKCVSHDFIESNKNCLLNEGDFIFADTSEDLEGSGNFSYLNQKSTVFAGYHTIIARPKSGLNHRYLAYMFDSNAYRGHVRTEMKGVKVYSVSQGVLKSRLAWLPPIEEQDQIVKLLDEKTSKIDTLIAKQRELIAKLKNYRTSIISHAVTGKIDVRDLVA
ncbi:restriction endonuclease subunit S [Acinetobacter baumannii]|nr:restriction endonuclease subunit S [Acinetobacter baumannii]EKV2726448.1 restriction endonuclease subunit S [Acinetobacter baumannii]EKV2808273.1 restriction endonuclease subunit S [Acinetobacter baumannii]EKV2949389.1 restriction endonuclease subunit S [Acinetobacter baumannii]